MYNQYNQNGQTCIPHTKKAISEFIVSYYLRGMCSEVVWVDSFESFRTRHICNGSNIVTMLDKQVVTVPTNQGNIPVESIFCPNCRKLILNGASI